MFCVQGEFKCIVGEFIGIFGCSLRVGAASRGANKLSVRCVGVLFGRKSSSEFVVSSLCTFRLSLSLQTIEVLLNVLCAFYAFGVRFVYVWLVSRVSSIVESSVILG